MLDWVKLPPRPGEDILCVKTGTIPFPGTDLSLVGGLLILTTERLYLGPLDIRLKSRLRATRTKSGGSLLGIGSAGTWLAKSRVMDLRDILEVQPVRRSSLRVTTRDGRSHDFGVMAGTFSLVWSKKNPPHRDEMLRAIRQALPA